MILILPLHVVLPRKKQARIFILNLNVYRNTHYIVLNQAKALYKEQVEQAYEEWLSVDSDRYYTFPDEPYHFSYTVYPANNRAFDISNICSIVDKFTCDALQELGVIKNDNHKFISKVSYKIGKVDKDNPRVELEIETNEN
jgi:Holliday junction resolvase RusA-like endonuclease